MDAVAGAATEEVTFGVHIAPCVVDLSLLERFPGVDAGRLDEEPPCDPK